MNSFKAGALLAGLSVAAGAFGAHGLEDVVTPERLETFETAVKYHMYHALALLILGLDPHRAATYRWSCYCFLGGIIVFSGSLYLLVLTDTPWLGAVTPFGGGLLIAGWALLLVTTAKKRAPN